MTAGSWWSLGAGGPGLGPVTLARPDDRAESRGLGRRADPDDPPGGLSDVTRRLTSSGFWESTISASLSGAGRVVLPATAIRPGLARCSSRWSSTRCWYTALIPSTYWSSVWWRSRFRDHSGILRIYLFAHTTNRIDVELGAPVPPPAGLLMATSGASAIGGVGARTGTSALFSPARPDPRYRSVLHHPCVPGGRLLRRC